AGTELFSADVNADGIIDLIVGVPGRDPLGRFNAGAVHVIPGGPSFGGVIDLVAPPASVLTFYGKDVLDRLGIWVEAGEINGDGIADLLMGADQGDGPTNTRIDCGETYVVFGGQAFAAITDFASPPAGLTYSIIYGIDPFDHLGTCLHAADLDSDGF